MNVLLVSIGIALSFAYSAFAPQEPQSYSAALPSATAVFETSLAAPISSSATSLTLTANAVRGGGSIAGYTCFTIDEGSAQHEVVCGTVSGTSVTSLTRGISFATGTSTVSANQFAHRRGANVKITDFPILQILKAQANGEDTFPNILQYTSHPTFTANTDIVDKKYVDDIAFSGAAVIDATTAARGVGELATQAEAAASTATGSSGVLLLPASMSTSTYATTTAPSRLIMTGTNGAIDPKFFGTTTLVMYPSLQVTFGATTTFSGPVVFASTTQGISGKLGFSTSTPNGAAATSTLWNYTVPANTLSRSNYVHVEHFITSMKSNEGTCRPAIELGYGYASTTVRLSDYIPDLPDVTVSGKFDFYVFAASSTQSQTLKAIGHFFNTTTGTSSRISFTGNIAVDSTQAKQIAFNVATGAADCAFVTDLVTAEVVMR